MAKTSVKRGRKASKSARPGRKKPASRKAPRKAAARGSTKRRATAKRVARPTAARRRVDPMRALAERIIAVTVGNDDEATLALYAADVQSTEMGQAPMTGIDALKQKFQMWRSMTSGASFEPRGVAVDGDTIMIEWVGTITLAASSKTVALNEVAIHEIENGRIARERFYYDPAQLRQ